MGGCFGGMFCTKVVFDVRLIEAGLSTYNVSEADVSTLMYTLVPVDRRVVFGSACGVIWGVYLSLYAAV